MIHRSGTELINPFKVLERVGIREGMFVADLGCGYVGHFVFPAAQLVGGKGRVYGVDIQKDALEHIVRKAKEDQFWNIETVWSDIDVFRATRIDDASLDLTLLINNLYISQNRPSLVREVARLTKPGGIVVVIEWKPTHTPLGPPTERRLSSMQSQDLMKSPMLAFHDEFEAGPYHYGLIYRRTDASLA